MCRPSQLVAWLGFFPAMIKTCPVSSSISTARAAFAMLAGLSALVLSAPSAQANALYRCVDKNGVTAYTSSRTGYQNCKLVGNFPAQRNTPKATAPAIAPAAPAKAAVEFRTAPGEAEPKAAPKVAGSTPTVTRGAVYKFEKNGVTHYTNRRPSGQRAQVLFTYIETCFACGITPGLDFNSVGLNLTAYAEEIATAIARHGVDEALVRAVIHAESAFNPNAISRAGAQGLMQLIPATATRFGVSDPFTPAQNIAGGVEYLAWLTKRFDGDFTKIAAGYNAGEGAVDRYGGVPPYQETIRYVERVGILRQRYQAELAAKANASAALTPLPAALAKGG